jgi:hypothetical protein
MTSAGERISELLRTLTAETAAAAVEEGRRLAPALEDDELPRVAELERRAAVARRLVWTEEDLAGGVFFHPGPSDHASSAAHHEEDPPP